MLHVCYSLLVLFFSGPDQINEVCGIPQLEAGCANNVIIPEVSRLDDKAYPPQALISLGGIRLYQTLISPARRGLGCPMIPSCSSYAYEAFRSYGFIRGYLLTIDRLLRCGRDLENYNEIYAEGTIKYVDYLFGMTTAENDVQDIIVRKISDQPDYPDGNPWKNDPEDERRLFSFAQQLYLSGEYRNSTTEFRRFLSYYPRSQKSIAARWGIYHSYYSMGMLRQAIEVLPNLYTAEENPEKRIRIGFIWGSRYFELGEMEHARNYFNYTYNRLEDDEARDRAKILLSITHAGEGGWDQAREEIRYIPYDSGYYGEARELNRLIDEAENQKYRDPLLAGVLGIVPGLGYLYNGYLDSAVAAFVVNGLLIWGTYEAFDRGNYGLGGFLGICTFSWYAGSIYGSVETAKKVNERIKNETIIKLGLHLEY